MGSLGLGGIDQQISELKSTVTRIAQILEKH
jgi:hypothetical protein